MTIISIQQLTFYFTGRSTFYWKPIFYLNFNALIGTFFTPGPLVCQTIFYLLVLTLIKAAQSVTIRWSHTDILWSDQTASETESKNFYRPPGPGFWNRDGSPFSSQFARVKIGTWYPISLTGPYKDLVCKVGTTEL